MSVPATHLNLQCIAHVYLTGIRKILLQLYLVLAEEQIERIISHEKKIDGDFFFYEIIMSMQCIPSYTPLLYDIAKLEYAGVYLIQNIDCRYSLEPRF